MGRGVDAAEFGIQMLRSRTGRSSGDRRAVRTTTRPCGTGRVDPCSAALGFPSCWRVPKEARRERLRPRPVAKVALTQRVRVQSPGRPRRPRRSGRGTALLRDRGYSSPSTCRPSSAAGSRGWNRGRGARRSAVSRFGCGRAGGRARRGRCPRDRHRARSVRSPTPRPPGVHLHWAMPDALLRGARPTIDRSPAAAPARPLPRAGSGWPGTGPVAGRAAAGAGRRRRTPPCNRLGDRRRQPRGR